MTGLEYLKSQVHPFGYQDKVSILTFPDEENSRCPFCGKHIKSFFDEKNENIFTFKQCDCKGGQQEVEIIKELSDIRAAADKLMKEYQDRRKVWEEQVYNAGVKIAAKHYMSQKPQRDTFDSEIEQLTK